MGALISKWKRMQSAPPPNDPELFFAIPALYYPNQTQEEWDEEVQRMAKHSQLSRQFLAGTISPADYEIGIAELGINPYELEDLWAEGETLL